MNCIQTGLKVALLIILLTFLFMFSVVFLPMTDAGNEHAKTIVGFLLGTCFATLLNFYWGGSHKPEPTPGTTTETKVTTAPEEK